jgi:NTP pyrophosphatase (non-canonical NTP hydrolase)
MTSILELTEMMKAFVDEKGWSAENSPKVQSPRNMAISLSLEAAEVLEYFQWSDEIHDKEAFELELADVLLYLLQLARIAEIDLDAAVLKKLEINRQRHWETPN